MGRNPAGGTLHSGEHIDPSADGHRNYEGQGWHRSAATDHQPSRPGSTPGSPRGHPSGHSGGDGLRGEPPPSGRQQQRSADTKTAPGSRPGSAQRKGVGT